MVRIMAYISPPYSLIDESCTAVKMVKANVAEIVPKIPDKGIILLPQAEKSLQKIDLDNAMKEGIVVIDAPWESLPQIFKGITNQKRCRKLPVLIASNPAHPKSEKITTAEAVIASLLILGLKEQANSILNLFPWKEDFLKNNSKNGLIL
jgi:pre-rRNA-processing protein TSR3